MNNTIPAAIGRWLSPVVGMMIVVSLYAAASFTSRPREVAKVASQFSFQGHSLPNTTKAFQNVRVVHPSLERLSAWMSSLGSSVALGDIDGDGLSNDVCRVDPRSDEVIVQSVPGVAGRYPQFSLDLTRVRFDSATMAPMGCLISDFTEDGLMDLMVYFWGRTPILFLRQTGLPGVVSRTEYVSRADGAFPSRAWPDCCEWRRSNRCSAWVRQRGSTWAWKRSICGKALKVCSVWCAITWARIR